MVDPYPPVADQFKLLAMAAIVCGTTPIDIFDAVEELVPTEGGPRRRIDLIEEWKRRRHEVPWYFDREYWDEQIRQSKMIIGDETA